MAATLEELEARVTALEARDVDYRSVLAAVNALGANQREQGQTLREHGKRLANVERDVADLKRQSADTNARVRSLEEGQAEIKDLLVEALDKK